MEWEGQEEETKSSGDSKELRKDPRKSCSGTLCWPKGSCGISSKREPHFLPQNMHLWHKDYLRLIIFKKEQKWEKL